MSAKSRSHWATFAAIMMFGLGGMALLSGLLEVTDNSLISDQSSVPFNLDLLWYGTFDLLIAVLAFFAGYGILKGSGLASIVAYVVATLNTVKWFLFLLVLPALSVVMIALWVLVIYALTKSGDYTQSFEDTGQ